MATDKTHTQRVCFECGAHVAIALSEPIMKNGIVKWACTVHGLGTPAPKPCPCGRMTINDCTGECGFMAKRKRPTIVVYLRNGYVEEIITDIPDGEEKPAIFVSDFDIDRHPRSQEFVLSVGGGAAEFFQMHVTDWSDPSSQPGVVQELYDLLAAEHESLSAQSAIGTELRDQQQFLIDNTGSDAERGCYGLGGATVVDIGDAEIEAYQEDALWEAEAYDLASHGGGPIVPLSPADQARQDKAEDRLFPGLRTMKEEEERFMDHFRDNEEERHKLAEFIEGEGIDPNDTKALNAAIDAYQQRTGPDDKHGDWLQDWIDGVAEGGK